jgi:hypothetical protein
LLLRRDSGISLSETLLKSSKAACAVARAAGGFGPHTKVRGEAPRFVQLDESGLTAASAQNEKSSDGKTECSHT